jgi:glycosyltransferase involved in cell wall biosynthesis
MGRNASRDDSMLDFPAVFAGLTICVVVPAFNEARAIVRTVRAVPTWVDRIVVVDDASHDDTSRLARRTRRRNLEIVRHRENRGVGGAIITGYRRVLDLGLDVAVVMAGDGQMDPADLPTLLAPIAEGRADYVKGNRFRHPDLLAEMPPSRIVGNVLLSLATKVASGYWHLFDSQCGIHRDHARRAGGPRAGAGLRALRLPVRPARAAARGGAAG